MEKTPESMPTSSVKIVKNITIGKSKLPSFMKERVYTDHDTGEQTAYTADGEFRKDSRGIRKLIRAYKKDENPVKVKLDRIPKFDRSYKANNKLKNWTEADEARYNEELLANTPKPDSKMVEEFWKNAYSELEVAPGEEPDTTSDIELNKLTIMGNGLGKGPNYTFYKLYKYNGKAFAKVI